MISNGIRGLSNAYIEDLQKGVLASILAAVQGDDTLSLCIRNGYVNIYYRGGSLLKITDNGHSTYSFEFDRKYEDVKSSNLAVLPQANHAILKKQVNTCGEAAEWVSNIPLLKSTMDIWFGLHPKLEREYQQLIERANNSNPTTDYFVADIEYTNSKCKDLRADIVAFHWPSTAASRKRLDCARLSIVEVKHGNGAIVGKSGLTEHIKAWMDRPELIEILRDEMLNVFNQRSELGLLRCHTAKDVMPQLECVSDKKPMYIILMSDHDPASKILVRELKEASCAALPFDVYVASASMMGYGLFDQGIQPLSAFLEKVALT